MLSMRSPRTINCQFFHQLNYDIHILRSLPECTSALIAKNSGKKCEGVDKSIKVRKKTMFKHLCDCCGSWRSNVSLFSIVTSLVAVVVVNVG